MELESDSVFVPYTEPTVLSEVTVGEIWFTKIKMGFTQDSQIYITRVQIVGVHDNFVNFQQLGYPDCTFSTEVNSFTKLYTRSTHTAGGGMDTTN